jgi:hypothetical protein
MFQALGSVAGREFSGFHPVQNFQKFFAIHRIRPQQILPSARRKACCLTCLGGAAKLDFPQKT